MSYRSVRDPNHVPLAVRLVWGRRVAEDLKRFKLERAHARARYEESLHENQAEATKAATTPATIAPPVAKHSAVASTAAKEAQTASGAKEVESKKLEDQLKNLEDKLKKLEKSDKVDDKPKKTDEKPDQSDKTVEKPKTSGKEKHVQMSPSRFTEEQDEQLLKLKYDNPKKSWEDLCTDMGVSQRFASALRSHFKTLVEIADETDEEEANKKKPRKSVRIAGSAKKNDGSREEERVGRRNIVQPTANPPLQRAYQPVHRAGPPFQRAYEPIHRAEPPLHPYEWQLLNRMCQEDYDDRLLRVSSRFYDTTGRRLPEDQIIGSLTRR